MQAKASGEIVSLEARAVVVAAGCGTKRLLGDVFAVDEAILDRIKYTKAHMICLRGPAGVLPDVGTVVAPELMIVGHPSSGHPSPSQGLVTWYVTPAGPAPAPRHEEAPDNGAAAVDAPVVTSGVEALGRLVPSLSLDDERIQATVFAGYKQDFDGEPTRRVCEVVDAERNVLMVLPSVLANAVPNALDALTLIRARLEGTVAPPDVPRGPGVAVGELKEDADPTRWTSWGDFAHMYEGRFE